ncbi:MAG: tetratricopeptide repeat protein [Saprospiraceae bacterium]
MQKINKSYFLILIFFTFSQAIIAQSDERWSENDAKLQDRYFDAKLKSISGKSQDAMLILDSLRRIEPENAGIFYAKYQMLKKDKKLIEAEENLAKAAQLRPDDIQLQIEWAKFMNEVDKGKEAMALLESALSSNIKNSYFTDALIQIQIDNGASIRAINTLDQIQSNFGITEYTSIKKAELYDKLGDESQAINELNSLIAHSTTEKVKYLMLLAKLYEGYDNRDGALKTYQKILEVDPENQEAKFANVIFSGKIENKTDFLVTFLPLISNPDITEDTKIKELLPYVQEHAKEPNQEIGRQLIQLCDKLVCVHPDGFKSHAIYADVLMNAGDIDAAVRQYEKTLSLNKKNPLVWEQLLYGYEMTENFQLLEKTANDALDYFPNRGIFYYFYAKGLLKNKKVDKVQSTINDAMMVSSGNRGIDSKLHYVQAMLAIEKKDITSAWNHVNTSLELSENQNGYAYEIKGDLTAMEGDKSSALKAWKNALDLGINTKSLNEKIAKFSSR